MFKEKVTSFITAEEPAEPKLRKSCKYKKNLLDSWRAVTLFFSHCCFGVNLFHWSLAHVSKSLDACSEFRCDILLTQQKVVPVELELIK